MYKRQKRRQRRRQKRRRKQRGGLGFGGFGGIGDFTRSSKLFQGIRKLNEFSKQKGFVNKAKYILKNIKLIKYV